MAIIPLDLRIEIYRRDKNTCQYCGKEGVLIRRYGKPCVIENPRNVDISDSCGSYNGLDVIPFEIDHIIPLYYGGKTTADNLILSCRKCNRSKAYKMQGVNHGE
jgi:5-methylcytosine-specific restriction endonuclease McrA